uniref:PDZ domain-containing protein n=1 Tax=Alexandrium monilatum TaxID=311494 RepID=A0A7S4QPE4_9DINO
MAGGLRAASSTQLAFAAPVLPPPLAVTPAAAVVPPGSAAEHASCAATADGPSALAVAGAAVALAFGGVARRRRRRRAVTAVARSVSRKEWNERVKRIQDYRAVFDVTIPKPLGVTPKNFQNRPGVGIAQIKPDGNTADLNNRVILEGFESMFVLEGDEVIAVDGVDCEGKNLDYVGALVKSAPGDSITLTLCRNYQKGPVKVVWMPGEEMITMNRGSLLRTCAETARAEVRYSCKDGWCSSCWHTEDTSDLVHRICKFNIPKDWDNVKPLVLLRADFAFKTKGLLVKNLMQADGWLPPPPVGVDANRVRKDMEEANVTGM